MPILTERDRERVQQFFSENLTSPAKLNFFTQTIGCETCRDAEMLLKEIAALSPKIELITINSAIEKEAAAKFGVDRVPALVITGARDYRLRYFGIPAGYEFRALMEDISDVSKADSGLTYEAREFFKTIQKPLRFMVFVTPTCPYCPQMVRLVHKAAIESEWVTGDMVEAIEFPDLAARYEVMGVPKTILNDKFAIEGALPEPAFVEWLKRALEQEERNGESVGK